MSANPEPRSRLYTLTLRDVGRLPSKRRPLGGNISGAVDHLIWTVQTAAEEPEELRAAKALLEQAIESYIDDVASRFL
jgi:hypothetical protein